MKRQELISRSAAARNQRGVRPEPTLCSFDVPSTQHWNIRASGEALSRSPCPFDGHSMLSTFGRFKFCFLVTFQPVEEPLTQATSNPFQKSKRLPCVIPQSLRNLQRFLCNEPIWISTEGLRRPLLPLCFIQQIRVVVHLVSLKLRPLDRRLRDTESLGCKRAWSSRTGSIG